jgi:hypothetical protein
VIDFLLPVIYYLPLSIVVILGAAECLVRSEYLRRLSNCNRPPCMNKHIADPRRPRQYTHDR